MKKSNNICIHWFGENAAIEMKEKVKLKKYYNNIL